MKQMVNVSAPVLARMAWGELTGGFFRRDCDKGAILFAVQYGDMIFAFPVFKDGTISTTSAGRYQEEPYLGEMVDVIHPKDLGITEIKWTARSVRMTLN